MLQSTMLSVNFRKIATLINRKDSVQLLTSQRLSPDVIPVDLGGTLRPDDLDETVLQRLEERHHLASQFRLPESDNFKTNHGQ